LVLDAILAAVDRIAINLSEPDRGIPIDTPHVATLISRLKEELLTYGAHLLTNR
jgi:hypothetical protein